MLDDHKYSVGRLVVYKHPSPKLPRQSYGHHGHEKTIGEVTAVDLVQSPEPHWVYSIRNVRNHELARVDENQIRFATTAARPGTRSLRETANRIEDGALAEMIAQALSSPEGASMLKSSLGDLLRKEDLAARAWRDGADLPLCPGDYVRIRGGLRRETDPLHNHYAKVTSVAPADIAGIENPQARPGQPRLYRTLKKYAVVSSEGLQGEVYDAEIKLFYTANGRQTIFNWRAATLLAEAFGDDPPYSPDYEYLAEHIFTREELKPMKRTELVQLLASILYAKGKMGLRDYQRRGQVFARTPRTHLVDAVIEISRFDARRNRLMSPEEIAARKRETARLKRLLEGA